MLSGPIRSSVARRAGPIQLAVGSEPTFCPRCQAAGEPDQALCRDCGEVVQPCGFCPTCEAFWQRSLGDPCPKHDVELEAAPPIPEPIGSPGQVAERWVTVAIYVHPNEANAPRIRLEAEGVPTFLDGARVAVVTPYQVATGGVRLQVPESLAASARVLLSQTWSVALDPQPDDGFDEEDDPWVGLAPEPGTRRRAIMRAAILVFLFGPGLIVVCNTLAHALGWVR